MKDNYFRESAHVLMKTKRMNLNENESNVKLEMEN